MSHQLPPDPDPATGFIALLLPAPSCSSIPSFIASGQDRTDKGLRTERSISVGADICTANSLDQESCQDLGRPYHLTCFLREMEKRRVWGTNCHLRHVARGFSNLCGMRASKQWKLMVAGADYPSPD